MDGYNADLKIEYVPIGDVKPYENNPRKNEAAIPALKESIKDFRFSQPISVDADGVVITGHTRLLAAKALGMETVPVIRRADLTPEQVKALRIADNKVGELAEWDFDALKVEMDGISDFDLSSLGFDMDGLYKALGAERGGGHDRRGRRAGGRGERSAEVSARRSLPVRRPSAHVRRQRKFG